MRVRRAVVVTAAVALTASILQVPSFVAPGARAAAQAAVPDPPTVFSAEYPDDFDLHGGVGSYGNFVVDDPGDTAVSYAISFNSGPSINVATTDGAAVTVRFLPTSGGTNWVTATSVGAGNIRSAPTTYLFRVADGTEAKARWKLDEPEGATTLQAVTRANEPEIVAQPQGGVTLGAEGQIGTAMSLDGSTAHAVTTGPIVDTTQSYTVSAWVRPTSTADATVAAQAGDSGTGFALSSVGGHWVFGKFLSDDAAAKSVRVVSDETPQVGEWNHVVGSYDAIANKLSLYVNGDLTGETPLTAAPWNAGGPFSIGAGSAAGEPADFFPGEVDEVRVYDRIVVADEVKELFRQPPVLKARWKLNVDGTDEPGHSNALTLTGGATIDPSAGFFFGSSPAGLLLNGTGGYAESAAPVVRTDRSFTITAWAHTATRPAEKAMVFSQAGTDVNRFAVRYLPGGDPATQGQWQLQMADEDTATARISTATHSNYTEDWWDHLALVYDAYHDTMTLYANGNPETTVSTKSGVLGFHATNGGLQIGRSKLGDPEYWPGAIDDIWAYQGVLSQDQIQQLAGGIELDTEHGPGGTG